MCWSQQQIRPKAHKPQAWTGYRVRNLNVTIRATMLAKIRRAEMDLPIIGRERAVDGAGCPLGGLWNPTTLPSFIGLRACGSGAAPTSAVYLANSQHR
jgi:hypothetical protein